ncbi:cytochrome P450 [Rhodococcus wratislaviensis]|nr:cytochrome P450 [Rhodococcus sp. 3A]MBC2894838.1 cytochrome P450 [Rhodococcus sp. 4CII]
MPTRTIVDDSVEVGGVTIPRGERVHFPVAAANRDPKYYPDPDEVRFDRDARPHLAFGIGPHRCLGLNLARLELKIAFTELRRRIPKFERLPGKEPHEHLGLAWGVENIHLKFPAAERETPQRCTMVDATRNPPGELFEPITIVLARSSPVVTDLDRDLHDPMN